MDIRIHLRYQRDLLKILNQIQKNIHRTQNLILKADKIINGLEIELMDFSEFELDDAADTEEHIRSRVESVSINDRNTQAEGTDNNSTLNVGERVVWLIRDDEPVIGTVMWIGTMSDGLVAGVEFDDPIGNTDGNLDGKRIYDCKPQHGRFVLVRELILWTDYAG